MDGNDVLATYSAAKQALDKARSGGGPTLIESTTYRLMMHTTADDPKKYRSEEEEKEAWKREPIPRFRKYIEKKGIWDVKKQEALEQEAKAEVDATVTEFEAKTDFDPAILFDHVFGTKHDEIEEQRAQFLANAAKEAADA